MNIDAAEALAISLMKQHLPGGPDQPERLRGWGFVFDQAPRRFGRCNYNLKRIQLSARLTALNSEAEVRMTILHEIAHAIAGHQAGHGPAWRRIHVLMGGDGQRCYSSASVVTPPRRAVVTLDMLG